MDTCETCGAPAVGYGKYIGKLPNRRRACRDHANPDVLYQRNYGYTSRDEAETHILATILEAADALTQAAEFDGFRGELYRELALILGAAHETLRTAEALG